MRFDSSATIQKPRAEVWAAITNKRTWQSWYGGRLEAVEPSWQVGASMKWGRGFPSRIAEITPEEKIVFVSQSSGMRSILSLKDAGEGSCVATYEEDFGSSSLSVTNTSAKQAQCNSTVRNLKSYAETHGTTKNWFPKVFGS